MWAVFINWQYLFLLFHFYKLCPSIYTTLTPTFSYFPSLYYVGFYLILLPLNFIKKRRSRKKRKFCVQGVAFGELISFLSSYFQNIPTLLKLFKYSYLFFIIWCIILMILKKQVFTLVTLPLKILAFLFFCFLLSFLLSFFLHFFLLLKVSFLCSFF